MSEPMLGLFGKIPAENDFVGVHDESWREEALDDWMQRSAAALARLGVRLPAGKPITVLLKLRSAAFVVLVVPGMDRAGRAFPTVVFKSLASTSPEQCAVFALEGNPFATAAAEVFELVAQADVEGLARRLALVSGGLPDRLAAAQDQVREMLQRASSRPLLDHLGDSAGYAFSTLRLACQEARDGAPEPLMVRCPSPSESARVFWIVLASRWLGDAESAFVSVDDASAPDLELCFGDPPPELIASALSPLAASSMGHWLLTTSAESARQNATSTLSPPELAALRNPGATLGELLEAFCRTRA
jgi:type VI secretion system ImpM family protein